jgi:hypothetical protein
MMKRYYHIIMIAVTLVAASCVNDDYYLKDIKSNERAIVEVAVGGDFVQVGPALIDRAAAKISVRVLVQEGKDFTNVPLGITSSHKSNVSPSSGSVINFASNGNVATYTVTSETGEKRDWTIVLIPFTEEILGTYDIQDLVLFGGTGPEWNGGAVLKLTDKPWIWPETDGPAAELDNTLTFEWGGVTADGKTFGAITNDAGVDGLYADYQYVLDPATDVNHFYRTIPKGVGTWQHDYTSNTINFVFDDGTTYSSVFRGPGTLTLGKDQDGNDYTKTITDNSFDFTLNGTDDWGNIYKDYDKFVKRPRRFWIDVKRQ